MMWDKTNRKFDECSVSVDFFIREFWRRQVSSSFLSKLVLLSKICEQYQPWKLFREILSIFISETFRVWKIERIIYGGFRFANFSLQTQLHEYFSSSFDFCVHKN